MFLDKTQTLNLHSSQPAAVTDRRARPLRDLRLSVLDRCNLRCTYCMPTESLNGQGVFLPSTQLMTDPELCVLDEPFSGLDPVNVALVTDLIEERRAGGRTTVLSTHMMHQVEALCDRVALIHRGNLVVYGPLDEIRRRYSPHEVIVWTAMDLAAHGVRATQYKAGGWRVELPPNATPAGYLHELVQNGVLIDRYEPLVARMEEIFVSLVGGGR